MSIGNSLYKRNIPCEWKPPPLMVFGALVLGVLVCTHIPVFAWTDTGTFSRPRDHHTATLLQSGKVLVAAGMWLPLFDYNLTGFDTTSGLYDTRTGVWVQTGSIAVVRIAHTASLLPNGQVLLAGGYNWRDFYLSGCELYDPSNGSWSDTGSLGTARGGHTATLLPNGKVLAAGGTEWHNGAGSYHSGCELYTPSAAEWTETGSLRTARYYHTATLLPSGKVLVVGGDNAEGILFSCELYDPVTGTWTETGSLVAARRYFTSTLLSSGKVLVVGGYNANNEPVSSCEVYDPATGAWAVAANLGTAHPWHTATLLPSGKVLVTGGYNWSLGGHLSACEVYDPSTDSWTVTESLHNGRGYHSATLLPDGKVLVAGGHNNSSFLASCELYESSGVPGKTHEYLWLLLHD
ncbi:MAG: Kelch repeat-containing protein [Syntrophobacteraceae bacterium]